MTNYCDYGHPTTQQLRLLPTAGDDLHRNTITCKTHFLDALRDRAERRLVASFDFNPYPRWRDLKVYDPPRKRPRARSVTVRHITRKKVQP